MLSLPVNGSAAGDHSYEGCFPSYFWFVTTCLLPNFGENLLACFLSVVAIPYAVANYAPNKWTVEVNASFHSLSVPLCDEKEQGIPDIVLTALLLNDTEGETEGVDVGKKDEVTQTHGEETDEIKPKKQLSSMKIDRFFFTFQRPKRARFGSCIRYESTMRSSRCSSSRSKSRKTLREDQASAASWATG